MTFTDWTLLTSLYFANRTEAEDTLHIWTLTSIFPTVNVGGVQILDICVNVKGIAQF